MLITLFSFDSFIHLTQLLLISQMGPCFVLEKSCWVYPPG